MSEGRRFEYLGAVRGIAASVVFVAHVIQIFWLRSWGVGSWPHTVSSEASYYAVVVFFVLSGFLITHSIEANSSRHGKLSLADFFSARFARLYPPFLFALILSIIVFGILEAFALPGRSGPLAFPGDGYAAREIIHLPVRELLPALLMRNGMLEINGPLWSLYMEAKLYILFACGYALLQRGRSPLAVVALAIAFFGTLLVALRYNPDFLRYAAIWLLGSVSYYVCMQGKRGTQCLAFGCGLILVAAIPLLDLMAPYFDVPILRGIGRAVWIDVAIAAAIAWFLFGIRPRLGVGYGMAEYSYSLYALHFPVLLLFQALYVGAGNPSLIGSCLVCASASAATYALARVGGLLEAAKPQFQKRLLSLWQVVCDKAISVLSIRHR